MAPNPLSVIDRLRSERGESFEQAVADAFNSLGLSASLTETHEAESDVIAEALFADSRYFAIIECCAVDEQNEVGYEKLGQLRGNFMQYVTDDRRQKLGFKNAYKTVVGKPHFSDNAVQMAAPDVSLIDVGILVELLKLHSKYRFSQDELESIFRVSGQVKSEHLLTLVVPHQRKISTYALICLALLREPYSNNNHRKPFAPVEQVIGSVATFGDLLSVDYVNEATIQDCLRDLQTPFLKLVYSKDNMIRLSSLDLKEVPSIAGELGSELLARLEDYKRRLERMRKA